MPSMYIMDGALNKDVWDMDDSDVIFNVRTQQIENRYGDVIGEMRVAQKEPIPIPISNFDLVSILT